MQFLKNNLTFFTELSPYISEELGKSYDCCSKLHEKSMKILTL